MPQDVSQMSVSSSVNVDPGKSDNLRLIRARAQMRDGISLNVHVYLPRNASGPIPAVVELTPYTVETGHGDGQYFPKRGLAYVVADVRGRGDSEGEFSPATNDARDGFDLIEWVVAQDWSDGRVVLYGGSYTGQNQWLMLGQRHPALVAASPAAAFAPGIDVPRGGIPNLYEAKWRSVVWGKALYAQSGADNGIWNQEIRQALDEERPIWTAAEAFGLFLDDDLRKNIEEPGLKHWGDRYSSDEQLAGLEVPVLTVTGTHDDCMPGTIYHWERYENLASPTALAQSHLLIGPWDHAGTDSGNDSVGELQFSENARVSLRELRTDWFRHILFGEAKPELLDNTFVYYVAGAEHWKSTSSLSAATKGTLTLNAHALQGKNDVFHSGWLDTELSDGPEYHITLDPRDMRAIEVELTPRPGATPDNPLFAEAYNSLLMTQGGNDPTNQVFSMNVDGNGVVYHSAPFSTQIDVVGKPKLRLVVIPDQTDADLSILLHEIRPDGSAIFLSSDLVRLSTCNTTAEGTLLVGEENVIDIDDFRFCSRTLQQASRIRLTIRSPWSALIFPNADGLRDHPEVNLRILHRKDQPTQLFMPRGH
jgi:putative CocE/NonD family hydrolase